MTNFLTDAISWYVLCVKTNCEHKVKKDLTAIIASKGLESEIVDVCVPEKEEYVTKRGKNCLERKVVYPGYVYVKMHMTEKNWYAARNVSNVFGFLEAQKGQPLPLSAKEAAKIDSYAEGPARITCREGDKVSVTAGPWKDTVGTVTGVDEKEGKITLAVEMFMRTVSISLPIGSVTAA